ncbi:MAG: hypothetical protein C0497_01795 [Gemmatimonas sp.]|nr:hypothetical protein [Gemmatimonas sp.]
MARKMTTLGNRDPFADAMRELRARYKDTNEAMLDTFRAMARRLDQAPDDAATLESLQRELHRIRGTAGSFGFHEANRIAKALEDRAIRWSADPQLDVTRRAALVASFAEALGLALEAPGDVNEPDGISRRVIVLVDDDPAFAAVLEEEATLRGYRMITIPEGACDERRVRNLGPRLILIRAPVNPDVAACATKLGVPVLALESRTRLVRESRAADDGLHVVDIGDGLDSAFEVGERLLSQTGWSGATVLVVDDDPMVECLVRGVFADPEFKVEALDDPVRLVARLDESSPSLVLMDISMPGVTGIQLVKLVRAQQRYADIPVILMSANTDMETREAALRAGADEFLGKPFGPAELRARVAEHLERRRASWLAQGLHPATGLPAARRFERDAERALASLTSRQVAASFIAVRRSGVEGGEGDRAAWYRETARIARGLAVVSWATGYIDTVLCAVLALGPDETASRLARLGSTPPEGAPPWKAGIVAVNDLRATSRDVARCRRAALEAADMALRGGDSLTHRWVRDDELSAPDVIVVEDDRSLVGMIEYALQASGITFRAFTNGVDALANLRAYRIEGRRPVVLLDVNLPGIDGWTLYERLRAERPHDYHVAFVTVHATEADQVRALTAGAMDYVTKPVNLRVLMAKVQGWLQMARQGA